MKPKICKAEGCENEVVAFPNSTIKRKYCNEHAIQFAVITVRKTIDRQKKRETKAKKEAIMSTDEYRSKYVQPLINEIARLIDYGQPCIASGNFGKMNAGHYISTGANRTLTLNLHNIHVQSFESNHHKSGDNLRYREGLIKTYGITYLEQIEALKQLKPIKLTKEDLKEVKRIATGIIKELRENLQVRTPEQKIQLREYYNQQLNIY